MKRAFDLLASLIGLILLAPALLAIAWLVSRTSAGGPLFVQIRLGKSEKPFLCYKFRTMVKGAPLASSHEVESYWITPIGRRLRALKLDELPQLVNVLRGDMSLVGPRPCLPCQVGVIEARRARNVFSVRPGITGIAQLSSIDMSTPDRLAQADQYYLENSSFVGDIQIIFKTLFGAGPGDTANNS